MKEKDRYKQEKSMYWKNISFKEIFRVYTEQYILFFGYCKGKSRKNRKKIRQIHFFLYDTRVIGFGLVAQ